MSHSKQMREYRLTDKGIELVESMSARRAC